MKNLELARKLLEDGGYTCVITNGEFTHKSLRRGVAPLLTLLDEGADVRGFSAADKVVGKAAAYLYVALGVRDVYARVISRPSVAVLEEYGVEVTYETMVPGIRNRTDTGPCPMETAVKDCGSPEEALDTIRATMKKLNGGIGA